MKQFKPYENQQLLSIKAKVLNIRILNDFTEMVYVHFLGYDKRNDKWVRAYEVNRNKHNINDLEVDFEIQNEFSQCVSPLRLDIASSCVS